MADGVNRVTVLGNLGRDAETRAAGSTTVTKFTVACAESFKGKDGNWQEKTEWVTCELWGDRGSKLAQYLTKGQKVFAEGSLKTTSYEKNGEKRYQTVVNVQKLVLCGGKRDSAEQAPAPGGSGGSRKAAVPRADDFGGDTFADDSDIPFIRDATRYNWNQP